MESTPSRRNVLRVGGSLAALGLVGGLSGWQGRTSAASGGGPARIDTVPEGVTAAAHVDVDGLLNDQQLRDSLNSFARTAAGSGPGTNVSEALDRANDRLALDPREVSELIACVDATATGTYVGLRLWTDWSESTVTDQLGSDSEERTDGDVTVYDSGRNGSLAVLGDGKYVAGTTAAVEDALDVRSGDASAVSGEVRTAFTAARSGYVRLGFDVPAALLSGDSGSDDPVNAARHVEYGYGSVHPTESGAGVTLTFEATDEDGAETIEEQLGAALAAARGQLDATTSRQAMRDRVGDLLDGTEVVRDGRTVTVRNEDSGGELALLVLGAWLGGFALGSGRTPSGRRTPQATFGFEYDAGTGDLSITHGGGDHITASRLAIRGDGLDRTGSWRDLGGDANGEVDGEPAVVAGDRVALGAAPDYEALVTWESGDGSASTTLAEDVGPGA